MVTSETGLDISQWAQQMETADRPVDLDFFANFINESHYPHSAIIDLTSSDDSTSKYLNWIQSGLNIITANKKAGSGDFDFYSSLHKEARRSNRYFLYETTVGAGLPVLRTLRDLMQTGDELIEIEGVLSGTLSYLFNSYMGKTPFSEVVKDAKSKGYTEPDPRDDLSGSDVGRKLVILAREAGISLDRNSVTIESLVPESLQKVSADQFMARLPEVDESMQKQYSAAAKSHHVLRYVAQLGPDHKAKVSLKALPITHPFARLSGSDNIILFRTKRYNEQPMVIQGPGAGPAVTAAGVFAELLRLADFLGAPQ